MILEYAGGPTVVVPSSSRAAVLRRAPEWWRRLAEGTASARQQAPASSPKWSPPPVAGWLYAVACAGVSSPAYAAADKRNMPEQFTDAALADMAQQGNGGKTPIPLQLGHNGPTLVTTSGLNMLFRVHEVFGLCLEARLTDTALNRRVLEDLERGVLGVSVSYVYRDGWTVDRRGFGTVRIVNRAKLLHVALLPRDSGVKPAYPACWASGRRGGGPGCPPAVKDTARRAAYLELVRQAGAMS